MEEKITLCGDNCIEYPRYNAHTEEELKAVAELWYQVGWRACIKIKDMLEHSAEYKRKCKEVCSEQEYTILEKAFFNKENNLKKQ